MQMLKIDPAGQSGDPRDPWVEDEDSIEELLEKLRDTPWWDGDCELHMRAAHVIQALWAEFTQ